MGVLEDERAHLARARADLHRMREATRTLLDTQGTWGNDELTTRALAASLARRFDQLLDDGVTPLFFGRLDYATPEVFHVGRRHVTGTDGEPVVVDWRAPVAEPFYRASPAEPMGVDLRRRFGFREGALTAFEDDRLDRPAGVSQLLVEDIERPRTGPMRDIVATIQPEQDVLVRAPLEQTIAVQGAPGTGKTAVGLHRAAYLLYAHRQRLADRGVLVVGPNKAFLSYVQEVLPALGEVRVTQATVEELCPAVKVTVDDPVEVAVLKGSDRMAAVLERALWASCVRATEPLVHRSGAARWRVYEDDVRALERAVRARGLGWAAGRQALRAALAAHLVRAKEDEGIAQAHDAVARLAKGKEVTAYVDALWPPTTPTRLVDQVLTTPALLVGFDDDERALLVREPATRPRWSRADLPLLDEARHLVERQPGYPHVVLDEAQDLSAMQLRVVARRLVAGSATVLGDLAQATTPWALGSWEQVLAHLGKPDGVVQALTIGYRVPGAVLDLANRLLPVIAPQLPPATSLRSVAGSLVLQRVPALEPAAVARVQELLGTGLVAVVGTDPSGVGAALTAAGVAWHALGDEGLTTGVTLVPASAVKGLEFDHVVLLEPADLDLRVLYVALTRAVTSLTVLHTRDLPDELQDH